MVLNKELSQVFDKFEEMPMASGSIGQVYKASIDTSTRFEVYDDQEYM